MSDIRRINPKKENGEHVHLSDVQRLMNIINNRMDNGIKKPVGMPDHAQEAAKWFIKLLETRMKHEVDNPEINHYPYQDRLVDCLKTYYKFNRQDQQYILCLIDDGISWRGDSIEFMKVREKVKPEMVADKVKLKAMLSKMVSRMGA